MRFSTFMLFVHFPLRSKNRNWAISIFLLTSFPALKQFQPPCPAPILHQTSSQESQSNGITVKSFDFNTLQLLPIAAMQLKSITIQIYKVFNQWLLQPLPQQMPTHLNTGKLRQSHRHPPDPSGTPNAPKLLVHPSNPLQITEFSNSFPGMPTNLTIPRFTCFQQLF